MIKTKRLLEFSLGFLLLSLLTNAWSEVRVYKPNGDLVGTYLTIQEGINACDEGGTVSVSPGIYNDLSLAYFYL